LSKSREKMEECMKRKFPGCGGTNVINWLSKKKKGRRARGQGKRVGGKPNSFVKRGKGKKEKAMSKRLSMGYERGI